MSATSMLEPFGWSDRVAALMAGESHPARVVRVDRDRALVATAEGDAVALSEPLPAVGDWVGLSPTGREDAPWGVDAIAPRWSEVRRTDPRSEGRAVESGQVLAANVDLVCSVTPLDRPLSPNRIDRELALAWDAGAQPVVVLTKADRHPDVAAAVADLQRRLVGVDIIVTAALAGVGVPEIAALLRPNRTVMLLGASGAGKSTLANALLGDDVLGDGRSSRSRLTRAPHHDVAPARAGTGRRRAARHPRRAQPRPAGRGRRCGCSLRRSRGPRRHGASSPTAPTTRSPGARSRRRSRRASSTPAGCRAGASSAVRSRPPSGGSTALPRRSGTPR